MTDSRTPPGCLHAGEQREWRMQLPGGGHEIRRLLLCPGCGQTRYVLDENKFDRRAAEWLEKLGRWAGQEKIGTG